MNESAGEQLSELLNDVLQLPTTDALDAADEPDGDTPARPAREGLPRSFRMRHDAHYVDELLSAAPPATMNPSTRTSATSALALIAGRLESLVAHAAIIDAHQDSGTLVARSVQSEFARVARVARAAVIASDGETLYRRSVSIGEIADDVSRAIAAIVRFGGVECEITADDRAFTVMADPTLVVHAIVSTIDALAELLAHPRRRQTAGRGLVVRISLTAQAAKVRPALIVDVACPSISVSDRQAERLFENQEEDYRESAGAGVLLAAASRVARAHGGRSDVKRHAVAGITITFVYPQAPADSRVA